MPTRLILAALALLPAMTFAAFPTPTEETPFTTDSDAGTAQILHAASTGELSLIACAKDSHAAPGTVVWGDSWNELADTSSLTIAYKVMAGGEPSAVTLTFTGGSSQVSCQPFSITGYDSGQAPEISTVATAFNDDPDCSNLTPTGGAKDYLWFCLIGADGGDGVSMDTFPSGYGNTGTVDGGASAGDLFFAYRTNNAASEDPGAAMLDSNGGWNAFTVAIHPSSASRAEFSVSPTVTARTATGYTVGFETDIDATVYGVACPINRNGPTGADIVAGLCVDLAGTGTEAARITCEVEATGALPTSAC